MRSYWRNMENGFLVLYTLPPFYDFTGKETGWQWVDDARHCYGFKGL